MLIQEFWNEVNVYISIHPQQRLGQAIYNCLADIKPELAQKITSTEVDAFYDSTKVPAMSDFIQENWEVK